MVGTGGGGRISRRFTGCAFQRGFVGRIYPFSLAWFRLLFPGSFPRKNQREERLRYADMAYRYGWVGVVAFLVLDSSFWLLSPSVLSHLPFCHSFVCFTNIVNT